MKKTFSAHCIRQSRGKNFLGQKAEAMEPHKACVPPTRFSNDQTRINQAEIIRRESPEMEALFDGLASVAEQMSEIAATHRPLFGGDVYLTGREVTERLFISRRTLQDYRDRGLLPYTRIGGKMLYKLSDLERLLRENYRTQTPPRPLHRITHKPQTP